MRSSKLSWILALSIALVGLSSACSSDTPPVAKGQDQGGTSGETAPPPAVGADIEGAPRIAADEAVFDFGSIASDGSIEHVFKIKNIGDADLHIERVQKT